MTISLTSPRIPDQTTLNAADRLATAEELAAALDEAARRGARRISIGSGRSPVALATAHALKALWVARGGTVVDLVDWPESAASWLRPARRLAESECDMWIVVGTGRGWMQMISRLLWSTPWRPDRTIVVAGSADVPPVPAVLYDWDLSGMTGSNRGGDLWTIEQRRRTIL